jgi:hypothetical protein
MALGGQFGRQRRSCVLVGVCGERTTLKKKHYWHWLIVEATLRLCMCRFLSATTEVAMSGPYLRGNGDMHVWFDCFQEGLKYNVDMLIWFCRGVTVVSTV